MTIKDILELIQTISELEDFEVITSVDGLSLLDLAVPLDMVFLDISMTRSDETTICRQYKPVVLASANTFIR